MKHIIILVVIQLALFTSCGPSHDDEVAARSACQLVQRYEEMQSAKGTDRESITQEFFMNTMSDYVSIQAPKSNIQNVKELMKTSCGDKIEVFEEILRSN